jgi:hypothetical protein
MGPSQLAGLETDHGILMEAENAQIWVRARHLDLEVCPNLCRLHPGETTLAGTQPHQQKLVLLTALELENSAVGSVGRDMIAQLTERQRPAKPGGIDGRKVPNDLAKEAFHVSHSRRP